MSSGTAMDPLIVDARGLKCPLPVLKCEKALAHAAPGSHIVVLATDPVARIDIPHFCRQNHLKCTSETAPDGTSRFEIVVPPLEI